MTTPLSSEAPIDISVIITCHAEGILLHKTIASVERAIALLDQAMITHEIIVHADDPTTEMNSYIDNHKLTTLKDVRLMKNSFKDLGSSRNYAIQQAAGEYIATIDADDLMSESWLLSAILFLKKHDETTVAHSEFTVEFEGADNLIVKHGEIDLATDTLLSVYANRWNSVIVAPRSLLLKEPYTANSPGYGYEDWQLNCRLIALGVHNILIPETVIFVRRKSSNSEWLRQAQSMAVLRANPLLSFESVRKIINPFASYSPSINPSQLQLRDLKTYATKIIKRYPLTHKIAKRVKIVLKRQEITVRNSVRVPGWLQDEWRLLHAIDRQVFPSSQLMNHIRVYDTLTEDHKKAGSLYKTIVDSLQNDRYDYIIFTPWLIKGGADQYTIDYANMISELRTDKKVLVIATLPAESVWVNKLNHRVDFLDFGNITNGASDEIKYRLMGHLIENGNITHIHIVNSEFGYDFIHLHKEYVAITNKRVTVTSFSQSVGKEGRLYGYSHTHVPFIYDQTTLITSDNQAVLDMWENEYGFDTSKMLVHRQAVQMTSLTPTFKSGQNEKLRILWAARIAPEKQPELLGQIGRLIGNIAEIDVYGTVEEGCEQYIHKLPNTVNYKGSFDGLATLPLGQYDYFLYTSLFDGMPNTILQIAQAGIPIISSSVGGIPEFITSKTGVPIADIKNANAYADAIIDAAKNRTEGIVKAKLAYTKLQEQYSPIQYKNSIDEFLKRLDY